MLRSSFSQVRSSFSDGNYNQPKPPSLPPNWPNPSEADLAQRPHRKIVVRGPQDYVFASNFIKTSKYTRGTFLPKFLAQEFHPRKKMANVYFFLVACMQMIPVITNTAGIPTVLLPLSFVVVVDAVFAALEDYARHQADDRANASQTLGYNESTQEFDAINWSSVQVGMFIKVKNREVRAKRAREIASIFSWVVVVVVVCVG